MDKSKIITTHLMRAGIYKIGHLRSNDQWIAAEELATRIAIHSVQTVRKLLVEIQDSFRILPQQVEMSESVFPRISVTVNVGDWQEFEGSLLSFKTPKLGSFNTISKKAFYCVCVIFFFLI